MQAGVHGRDRDVPADVDRLVAAVLTASRVLVGISARSLAGVEESITLTQFRSLVVLAGEGETNLNRLAEALGVQASTAARTVDRLVAAQLVTRTENPATRREVVLRLTEDGAQVVRRVTERRRSDIADVLARMPAEQRAALVGAFEAFTDAAHEPDVGPSPGAPLGW